MYINLFLIPFIILLGLLLWRDNTSRNRLLYIVVCEAVLVFIASMRSPEWMASTYSIDTANYQRYFDESLNMSWNDLWNEVGSRYLKGDADFDAGFIALSKIIGLITRDFFIYSLLADLLFFIPWGILLYRYCTNFGQLIFAFVFYVALLQILFLGGGRQNYAIGFDLMALISIIDKKRVSTVLFLLLGITIHFSSVLFIIPILMIWIGVSPRVQKALHVISFLLFPIVLMIPNEITLLLGRLSGVERYLEYGKGAIRGGVTTFIVMIEILSLFCLIGIKIKDLVMSRTLKVFYIMAPLFTVFAPLIRANGAMIRVSLYYHLFLVFLVPYSIEGTFHSQTKRFVYAMTIGILALFAIAGGGIKYYFYWQM